MKTTTVLTAAASLALSLGLALPAAASTLYSTGFEGPTFTPGPVAGQGGWAAFSNSSQGNLAQVESGVAQAGTQALSVSGSATAQTGGFYALTVLSPGVITVSGDVMLSQPDGSSSWQFAVTGPGLNQFVGGVNIFGNTIQATAVGFPSIGAFSYGVWHQLDLVLDYGAQTFSVGLDGSTLAAGLAFCGSNAGCSGAPVANFGDVIFDTFGNSGNTGYLDNLSISTGGVPEPATWGLMLAGFAALGATLRRRRLQSVLA